MSEADVRVWQGSYGSYRELCDAERTLLGMSAARIWELADTIGANVVHKAGTILRVEPKSSNGFVLTEEHRGSVTEYIFDDGSLRIVAHPRRGQPAQRSTERNQSDESVLAWLRSLRFAVMSFENGRGAGLHYGKKS